MDKVLVSIYVVTLDETYDLLLPINLKLSEVLDLIQNTIVELSSGNYEKREDVKLLNSESKLLNCDNLVRLSGITNGCKIMLI